jgi:hypothetical protein
MMMMPVLYGVFTERTAALIIAAIDIVVKL